MRHEPISVDLRGYWRGSNPETSRKFLSGSGKKNPALRKLYAEDLKPAERRLFLFLLQVFGGPQTYSVERGHPRLRMRHLDWEIDPVMRDHWLNAMLTALDKLKPEQNAKELMTQYFIQVANPMINHE